MNKWAPPRAGLQAAAGEAGLSAQPLTVTHRGLSLQSRGIHKCVVLFSQDEHVYSVEHSQAISFFYNKLQGNGKERKWREREGERDFYV